MNRLLILLGVFMLPGLCASAQPADSLRRIGDVDTGPVTMRRAADGQPVDIWDESPDDSGDDSDYDYGYDYDYRPGFFWRLTHTVPPFGWLIILGIPALIALIVCLCMKRSMKTAVSSGNANMYIRPDGVRLTRQNDIYTHTTVTRTQNVPDDDHNNSGSGGTTVNSGGFSSSHGKF